MTEMTQQFIAMIIGVLLLSLILKDCAIKQKSLDKIPNASIRLQEDQR